MGKKEKKTVLHICDYAALYRGNFIDSLESLEVYNSDIQNIYLFPSRAKNTEAEAWITEMNVREEIAYIQEKKFLKKVMHFGKILRKHRIDFVFRHFSDLRIDLVLKLCFPGKKVIRFFHGGYKDKSRLKHLLKRFLWKQNKLVGVSNAVAKEVQAAFPGFGVTAIENAIHFARLEKIEPFRKPEGISLLILGWDWKVKGMDLAVKALENLRRKYALTLHIVASKNEEAIQKMVRQILGQDPDWIRYLSPTNHVGTYYAGNDIFLSPSRREAFGYANIEAAYCKNSIVLSKVDGQGELQIEGAHWFESENLEDLQNCLEKAILELGTPETDARKERVRQQVQQKYSLEAWSKKVAEMLE